MKNFWNVSYLSALFAVAFATVANAQDSLLPPVQPVSVHLTNSFFQDDDNAPAPSASDVADPSPIQESPMHDVEDATSIPMADDTAITVDDVVEEDECEEDGPVRLFNTCHGIDVYGHLSFGIYDNGDGRSSGVGNAPLGFRNVSDGATMDQFWLTVEKTLDDCCPSWGFRIDYVFGADGPDTTAFGDRSKFDFRWQSSRDYGSAMPQLYAQYGTEDFNVKVGHFYTIIGYEVVSAPDNFFYSHSYMQYYAEPFTHTGFLVQKKLMCDQLTVWGGWTNGWDSYFGDHLNADTFLGGASYAANDDLTITYAVNVGNFGDGTARNGVASNEGDIYMQSIVVDYQINECMQYVLHTDYAENHDVAGGGKTEWFGVANYLYYTLSDCHKVGVRAEWFNDDDGARISNPDGTAIGNDVDYYSLTLGWNYTPNSNVIIRPEVRFDWADGGNPFRPVAGAGTRDEQEYYGVDFIVLF